LDSRGNEEALASLVLREEVPRLPPDTMWMRGLHSDFLRRSSLTARVKSTSKYDLGQCNSPKQRECALVARVASRSNSLGEKGTPCLDSKEKLP
jgi:hypothetical protein